MQLVKVTNDSQKQVNRSVSVNRKGVFCFSNVAVNEMKLMVGQKVDFFQDNDRKQDWYIQKKGDNSGECILREYGSTGAMMISCKSIAAKFREALGINDDKLHRFLIGPYDSKINMWPILAIKNPTLLNRM